jgi:hypothetical protein
MGIGDTVTVRDMLSLKTRTAGRGGPLVEAKVGDDLHRKSGRWRRLERIIDHARNWYREFIGDPRTGEVIRHVEEPLSRHIGHGAARRPAAEKDSGDV